MKKLLLSFAAMLMLCATMFAQAPSAFKYQAVARDASGQIMADKTMSVRTSIITGALVEYSETHTVTTNEFGLFTVEVGRGSPEQGDFMSIPWSQDAHSLRVEIDPAGGSNFMFVGTSELLAVPYAVHAETVTQNDDADADPTNEIQDLKVVGTILRITGNPNPTYIDLSVANTDDQAITYDADNYTINLENGGSVNLTNLKDDADSDPTNELQTVTQNGAIVTLSHGGGYINIEDGDPSPTNELQSLSMSGNTISLSQGGGSVTIVEADGDPANEIQDLAFNSNYLYVTNNPNATVIDLNPLMDNTDNQMIAFDEQTGILAIQYGNAVDLTSLIDDADADSTNEIQTITRVGDEIVLSHNGGTVDLRDDDADPANEIQTLSQNGTVVTLSNGGGTISIADDDSNPMNEIQDLVMVGDSMVITNNPFATVIDLSVADNQTLNFNNSTYEMTIDNGNTVDLTVLKDDADADPVNEIQDLYIQNDSLVITNNPSATVIDLSVYMDNTDAQTVSLSGTDLSISGGNTVDLVSFMDNTDAQTLTLSSDSLIISGGNHVDLSAYMDNTDAQDLSLSGNKMSLTGDATTVDLTSFLDNTDAQTLTLSNDSLIISGGNHVDLSAYMDNTDAQDLSISGNTLSLSGDATTVDLSSYLDADNMGNHTATQNIRMSGNYLSNDGDNEGIMILTNGNVNSSGDFFVGATAAANRDLWVSAKMIDWDNSSYYVDPNLKTVLSKLTVNDSLIATASVTANNFIGDGAGITNLNASSLSSGTVPSARMSGSYTGITGVGTITAGTWNGTTIAIADGGTGATTAAGARTNLGIVKSTQFVFTGFLGQGDYHDEYYNVPGVTTGSTVVANMTESDLWGSTDGIVLHAEVSSNDWVKVRFVNAGWAGGDYFGNVAITVIP